MSEHSNPNPPQHGEPRVVGVSEEAKQVWADWRFFWEMVNQNAPMDRGNRKSGEDYGDEKAERLATTLMMFSFQEREHRRGVYGSGQV